MIVFPIAQVTASTTFIVMNNVQPAAILFHFLQDRLGALKPVLDPTPPAPFTLPDVYLLASGVQKAIRRGDLEIARRAGHQLHGLDRQRLWRRLAVVTLEDIGISDTEATAQVMAIACLPAARRLFGDDLAALDAALAIACGAAKDRTADHFCSIVGREPVAPEDKALRGQASPNALFAVVASSGQPWARRLRAAVMVSGRAEGPPYHPDNVEALLEMYRGMGVPELLIAACAVYAAGQRDPLPVFVPLAWLLHAPGCTGTVTVHPLHDIEMTGDMPTWALDPVNCRLGRRAVDLFLRAHMARPAYAPRLVAAAIWNMESALCDRTLAWPLGDEIRQRAYAADLACRGLPPEQHDALNAWIAAERPALIAARQAVWNSAVREIGKPAEAPEQANLPLFVTEKSRRA
jgi:hypothetical protein